MNRGESHKVYLGLGTNLGDKLANINTALRMLEACAGKVENVSSIIETEPVGFNSPNTFMNAVVKMETCLSPMELLDVTQDIERKMGRTEKSANSVYHDRIIDIDILLYDDLSVSTPRLEIPHPRMAERDFVMRPLEEIR